MVLRSSSWRFMVGPAPGDRFPHLMCARSGCIRQNRDVRRKSHETAGKVSSLVRQDATGETFLPGGSYRRGELSRKRRMQPPLAHRRCATRTALVGNCSVGKERTMVTFEEP